MKRRCLNAEVVMRSRANGGRPSDRCWNECLLAEVKYAELVSDEVQASKEEGLGWLEDGWNPRPNRWECGKLQRAEASRIAWACHVEGGRKVGLPMTKSVNVQCLPHGQCQLLVQKVTNT